MISTILKNENIDLVLVDIGASGEPPEVWRSLGDVATYIGFDPDKREVVEERSAFFKRHIIINKAIMPLSGDVKFYLTQSPYCSSTLKPLNNDLQAYLFSDLFKVESETVISAVTLDEVLESQGVDRVDWLKTDSQGIDFQIYNSLSASLLNTLIAIDVEPGLINAYDGEDLFPDIHAHFINNGFWLSNVELRGVTRMNLETLNHFNIDKNLLRRYSYPAPSHIEARYLRTIDWMKQQAMPSDKYIVLIMFAIMGQHFGYAFDVLVAYKSQFGEDQAYQNTLQYVTQQLNALAKSDPAKSLWQRVKRRIRRYLL